MAAGGHPGAGRRPWADHQRPDLRRPDRAAAPVAGGHRRRCARADRRAEHFGEPSRKRNADADVTSVRAARETSPARGLVQRPEDAQSAIRTFNRKMPSAIVSVLRPPAPLSGMARGWVFDLSTGGGRDRAILGGTQSLATARPIGSNGPETALTAVGGGVRPAVAVAGTIVAGM